MIVLGWRRERLSFRNPAAIPNGATTGYVTVTTSGVTLKSNKIFRVIPQITSFTPASGPVNTVVTITGVSLKQTTKVTFGGVKATVPSGAKTGKLLLPPCVSSAKRNLLCQLTINQ